MILASNSPRRLQLLTEAGFNPVVHAEEVDESLYKTREEILYKLPLAKAQAAIETLEQNKGDEIVIAADTTVWIGDTALGKPHDEEDAYHMLKMLSGKTHDVITAVAICKVDTNLNIIDTSTFAETTKVTFYELSDEEIWEYIKTKEPHDKAGAYGIQGKGRLFVEGIQGDYFNVVGLPIARLARELRVMDTNH